MNLHLKILTIVAFSLKIIYVWHEKCQLFKWDFWNIFAFFLLLHFLLFDYLEDHWTVVVVVVHTPHSILKNDCTRTVICKSKCTVPMIPNPKKLKKKIQDFYNFLGVSRHLNSIFWVRVQCGCGNKVSVWVWTTTTLKCWVR